MSTTPSITTADVTGNSRSDNTLESVNSFDKSDSDEQDNVGDDIFEIDLSTDELFTAEEQEEIDNKRGNSEPWFEKKNNEAGIKELYNQLEWDSNEQQESANLENKNEGNQASDSLENKKTKKRKRRKGKKARLAQARALAAQAAQEVQAEAQAAVQAQIEAEETVSKDTPVSNIESVTSQPEPIPKPPVMESTKQQSNQVQSSPKKSMDFNSKRPPLRVKKAGCMFGDLKIIPTDPKLDPPPYTCYNCWQHGHSRSDCPRPIQHVFCYNCGRRSVDLTTCPRCKDKHREYVRDKKSSNSSNSKTDSSRKPSNSWSASTPWGVSDIGTRRDESQNIGSSQNRPSLLDIDFSRPEHDNLFNRKEEMSGMNNYTNNGHQMNNAQSRSWNDDSLQRDHPFVGLRFKEPSPARNPSSYRDRSRSPLRNSRDDDKSMGRPPRKSRWEPISVGSRREDLGRERDTSSERFARDDRWDLTSLGSRRQTDRMDRQDGSKYDRCEREDMNSQWSRDDDRHQSGGSKRYTDYGRENSNGDRDSKSRYLGSSSDRCGFDDVSTRRDRSPDSYRSDDRSRQLNSDLTIEERTSRWERYNDNHTVGSNFELSGRSEQTSHRDFRFGDMQSESQFSRLDSERSLRDEQGLQGQWQGDPRGSGTREDMSRWNQSEVGMQSEHCTFDPILKRSEEEQTQPQSLADVIRSFAKPGIASSLMGQGLSSAGAPLGSTLQETLRLVENLRDLPVETQDLVLRSIFCKR